jgi:hypothetical protein
MPDLGGIKSLEFSLEAGSASRIWVRTLAMRRRTCVWRNIDNGNPE